MKTFRPMLAAAPPKEFTPEQFYENLLYPVLATPKLDGIRCIIMDTPSIPHKVTPMTRSMKPIPNYHMFNLLATLPAGLDGELVAAGTFQNCQSAVMSQEGQWKFKYCVFDVVPSMCPEMVAEWEKFEETECGRSIGVMPIPYSVRIDYLAGMELPDWCIKVLPTRIQRGELQGYTQANLENGYEGSIIRTPLSPYKYGRSTYREQWMVKDKQFLTDEAVIIAVNEEYHNANKVEVNPLGYKERSSHSANMIGKGRMGSFTVRHKTFGDFNVGSGFTTANREEYWASRSQQIGRIVTFKYQPQGVLNAPRIPIFKAIRDPRDMDPVAEKSQFDLL